MDKLYRIKSTGQGQARFGSCERCGKHCSETFMQQWKRAEQKSTGWNIAGFGHVECLRNGNWADAPVLMREAFNG